MKPSSFGASSTPCRWRQDQQVAHTGAHTVERAYRGLHAAVHQGGVSLVPNEARAHTPKWNAPSSSMTALNRKKEVRVNRWCVRLGFTAHVFGLAQVPAVSLSPTMLRTVSKQPEEFGWPPQARAGNITGVLSKTGDLAPVLWRKRQWRLLRGTVRRHSLHTHAPQPLWLK